MMIGPTAHAFWNYWREEHRQWRILDDGDLLIATDAERKLASTDMELPDLMTQTYTAQVCDNRTEAHTYIALRCTQYALERLGFA